MDFRQAGPIPDGEEARVRGYSRLRAWGGLPALLLLCCPFLQADTRAACVVVSGLGGVPEWEENFESWADSLAELCSQQLQAPATRIDGRQTGKPELVQALQRAAANPGDFWLFLVGHGNFDGREYRFNIKGPDLTGTELKALLDSLGQRRAVVVLATSSSGDLVYSLAGPERVILAASRGRERHPPLFLSFFLEAVASAEADLNKDRRVSLQEAMDFCEQRVAAWYEEKGRIRTEHAAVNDADGTGRLAAVTFLSAPPEQAYRSLEAQGLAPERIRLEREIEDLKLRKSELALDAYYRELERLLVQLSELNERIRELEGEP